MSTKSNSDFDLRRRLLHSGGCILTKHGNDNTTYDSSTKSTASIVSVMDTSSTRKLYNLFLLEEKKN